MEESTEMNDSIQKSSTYNYCVLRWFTTHKLMNPIKMASFCQWNFFQLFQNYKKRRSSRLMLHPKIYK